MNEIFLEIHPSIYHKVECETWKKWFCSGKSSEDYLIISTTFFQTAKQGFQGDCKLTKPC